VSRRVALTDEERKARQREAARRYRAKSGEAGRERDRQYRAANRERINEQRRKRREANKDVEPLARGGLHTPDNLVPACQRCNLSKLAKPVEAWYLSQPFFSIDRWEALQAHTGRRWSAAEQLSLMNLLSA